MDVATYRDLGLTLHDLLAALEPARWRDDARPQLDDSFARLEEQLEATLKEPDGDEPELASVRQRLLDLAALVEAHRPRADDVRARWMEFRAEVHPAYEAFAQALKACHQELPHLRPTNYTRSLFHATSGLLALLFVEHAPWPAVMAVAIGLALFGWSLELLRRISPRWNAWLMRLFGPVAHPHERFQVNSSTWYTTALALLSLTGEPAVGATAVVVLGLADPAAALVGRRFGRTRLRDERSLEGSLAFVAVAFCAVIVTMSVWHAELSTARMVTLAALAAVVGAVTELFCRRVDDNFAIPVATGAVAWLILAL